MTRSEGIRVVDEMVAEKILLDRGFTKIRCVICDGTGIIPNRAPPEAELLGPQRVWSRLCSNCEGAGWRWQEPVAAAPKVSPP